MSGGGVKVQLLFIPELSKLKGELKMKQYMKLLGLKARDVITGVEGVIDSVCFDLYGCIQVSLRPEGKDKNDEPYKGFWYDHKRMVVLNHTPVMTVPNFDTEPGKERGPADKAPRR